MTNWKRFTETTYTFKLILQWKLFLFSYETYTIINKNLVLGALYVIHLNCEEETDESDLYVNSVSNQRVFYNSCSQ